MASEKDRLDERKSRILQAVTDDYISSAEPVGSRTIARKYDLGLSPATIRNEMADLEEEGYLQQPHTSAGRIPSDRGYRYYVDTLLRQTPLSVEEIREIQNELERRRNGLDDLLLQAGKLLAQVTHFPSMVMSPQSPTQTFRHIQFVPVNEKNVMVLVVTDTGMVENRIMQTEIQWSSEELDQISKLMNERLRGIPIRRLPMTVWNEIRAELAIQEHCFHEAVRLLMQSLQNSKKEKVYLDGTVSILQHPEFQELNRIKPLIDFLETEEDLIELLQPSTSLNGITIKIGHENLRDTIKECSLITANYQLGDRALGVIGILGPTRMDYGKVLSIVQYMSIYLSRLLTQMGKGD
jgi:heat-inducible transcriptional repressor